MRRRLWQRILADPSVTPQQLVTGWFYKEGKLAETAGGPLRTAALLSLFCGAAAARRARAVVGADPLPRTGTYGPPVPAGVEASDFSELSRGDVRNWLSRNLFYKVSRLCSSLAYPP